MIKVKISDQFLDGGSIIAQTYAVNDLREISTRQGGFSNTFSAPLTNKNKSLLSYASNLNTNTRKQYEKIDAELYDNNTRVASGYIKIVSVTQANFNLAFFSDNVEWFTLIKDKKMIDLDLSDYDHEYSRLNIFNSLNNDEGYFYPVIDYENTFRALTTFEADVEELYPAMFVHTLMEQIFKDIDYSLSGSLLTNPTYNRMILPFNNEELSLTDTFIAENTVNVELTGSDTVNGGGDILSFDTGPNLTATGDASYDITIFLNVTALTTNDFIATVEDGFGNDLLSRQTFQVGTYALRITNQAASTGDIFRVRFDSPGGGASETITLSTGTTGKLEPNGQVIEGSFLTMASLMPDMSQTDFIKYVFNVFGVIATVDVITKTVNLNLFRDIRDNIPSALDWSDKLDLANTIDTNFEELISDYAKQSIFEYLEDEDDANLQTYKSINGNNLGQGILTLNNEHLKGREVIYQAPFASALNVLTFDNNFYCPSFIKRGLPRILLLANSNDTVSDLTGGEFATFGIVGDGGTTVTGTLRACWFVKAPYTEDVDEYTDSLSFGDVTFTNEIEGLLTEYWEDYRRALNSMKYVRCYLRLDSADIQNLDFLTPVFIDYFNAYFYLNKVVDYTGKDELTEVELVKIG